MRSGGCACSTAIAHTPDPAWLRTLQDLVAWVELELHGGAAPGGPADGGADALARMQERFLTRRRARAAHPADADPRI